MNYNDIIILFFSILSSNTIEGTGNHVPHLNQLNPTSFFSKIITPTQNHTKQKYLSRPPQVYLGLDIPPKPLDKSELIPEFKRKSNSKFSMLGSDRSWDIQGSVNFLRRNAAPSSLGQCAKYIRLALANGGINIEAVPSAKFLGNSLLAVGFEEISASSTPIKGDIVVIQPYPGSIDGHSAMFDGEIWISDFKQQTLYPGVNYTIFTPPYRFYRKQ
ncbi:CHAP domain-containing protein [Thorsellia anophelis]|uniref:CHAP domain-containing protein n=1 Tax=Thorsellia anophelis DSM 18579 TaxID=1123402 RepID=A0A1I0F8M5_9GAMM|nr:CHAP domain-containing protein [Thorsellia anophelis]SET54142.1 hypothetical protein SAMN02583745_02673 [Thorsellia anophelis DSM 18579]